MTSKDGVNWEESGRILEPRKGTTWMGTGHIIESPDFKDKPKWIMNYSEWFGNKQDIMFATSHDLKAYLNNPTYNGMKMAGAMSASGLKLLPESAGSIIIL